MTIRSIQYDADGRKISENIEAVDEDYLARQQRSASPQATVEWKGRQRRPTAVKHWEMLFE
jgi:hypothetical protein